MGKFLEGLGDELSLYARQLAWLNAVPRDDMKKALNTAAKKAAEPSRLEKMRADGIEPPMPPLSVPLMVEWLLQIGPSESNGMGASPISWLTLDAWCHRTAIDLSPWQAITLRRMSSEFLAMADEAKKIDCLSPWATQTNEANREAVSRSVSAIFGARARGQPSRD